MYKIKQKAIDKINSQLEGAQRDVEHFSNELLTTNGIVDHETNKNCLKASEMNLLLWEYMKVKVMIDN